jgi:hypothetical protein
MSGVFDNQNNARDSATISQPVNTLDGYTLEWLVFIKVPGGGKGQFSVTVEVKQNGNTVGGPFRTPGTVDDVETVADFSDLQVDQS